MKIKTGTIGFLLNFCVVSFAKEIQNGKVLTNNSIPIIFGIRVVVISID